ncbi:MAG TPA: helix-turn-helix transcriptional regulator, partial [Phototrophicaceae bacterium]|nr:helix-turn-helix transcriptional regulator [Phototrophicaceae bacterium]
MANSNTITITDVARAAGVSVSTVSRILNGKQDVAAATRERVQQVIEELGFSPHAQAKRLRAGKTHNIGLLFPLKYPGKPPFNSLETDFIIGGQRHEGTVLRNT